MTKNEHCQEYTIPVLQPGSDHVQNLDINCINKIIRQELEESEHARQMKSSTEPSNPKSIRADSTKQSLEPFHCQMPHNFEICKQIFQEFKM